MISTSIITHSQGTHQYTGFAKDFQEWEFVLQVAGWIEGANFKTWGYEIETIDCPESEMIRPTNYTELWVLGSMIKMN